MLIKSFCLGAVLVSTPLCLMTPQDNDAGNGNSGGAAAPAQDPRQAETLSPRQRAELAKVKQELDAAKKDLADMRRQLEEVLDTLDATFVAQQHRNCSPSRNRALLSHYQWLDKNQHGARAEKALGTIVEQAGAKVSTLNQIAWSLMTDNGSAGKFDRVALALAERMESQAKTERKKMRPDYIDTIALAHFLNGRVESAVALQKKAIAAGGSSDDFRRRLRTYEAAKDAVALAKLQAPKAETPSNLTPVDLAPKAARNGNILASASQEDDE